MASATSLGELTGINTYSPPTYPLAILSSNDKNYFTFSMSQTPIAGDYVNISSVGGIGALELELINPANNAVITSADTTDGFAQISLYGEAKSTTYELLVAPYQNGTTPSYTLEINAPGGDRFEPDYSVQTAYNLDAMSVGGMGGGYVTGLESWDDLSVEPYQADSSSSEYNNSAPSSDDDWYSFTLSSEGLAGDYARIDYNGALGDVVLGLYEMENNTPTLITQASTAQSFEQISLQGLASGQTFYLEVSGYVGASGVAATNPDYTLTLNTPEVPQADVFETGQGNNTIATATNLGTIQGPETLADPDHPLSIFPQGDLDFYEFQTKDTGDSADSVSISYNQAAGPLVLELFNSSGNLIPGAIANTFGDTETISLNQLPASSYYVEVSGYEGATNPDYSLSIDAPGSATPDWVNQMTPDTTQNTAYPLGAISGPESWTGLSIQQDNDQEWFSFAVGGGGLSTGPDDSVGITFDPTEGQLSLTLLSSSGKTIGTSSAVGGTEEITLPPTTAATSYYVLVTGAANPDFTLSVTGPGTTATDQAIVEQNGGSNSSSSSAFDLVRSAGCRRWARCRC